MNKLLLVVLATVALAACNDNDDTQQMGVIAKPAPVPPVAVTTDKFTAVVKEELKDSSDDAEAKDIDSIALVTPEDAEPVPLN